MMSPQLLMPRQKRGVGTWRKCGEAWKSDVNDGGADIRCDRWLSGNRRKSSFVDFLEKISDCRNLSDG